MIKVEPAEYGGYIVYCGEKIAFGCKEVNYFYDLEHKLVVVTGDDTTLGINVDTGIIHSLASSHMVRLRPAGCNEEINTKVISARGIIYRIQKLAGDDEYYLRASNNFVATLKYTSLFVPLDTFGLAFDENEMVYDSKIGTVVQVISCSDTLYRVHKPGHPEPHFALESDLYRIVRQFPKFGELYTDPLECWRIDRHRGDPVGMVYKIEEPY